MSATRKSSPPPSKTPPPQAPEGYDDAPNRPEAPAPVVQKDEIVKGYEYRKGEYITIEPKELDQLRVPSKHTMEITQFVDASDIDPEFFEKPYFVIPENDAQAQAFAVVRQALKETKKVALTKIAFAGREHVVALTPTQDDDLGGMMAYTMRYAQELRDPKEYFAGRQRSRDRRRLSRPSQAAHQAQSRQIRPHQVRRRLRSSPQGTRRSQDRTRPHSPRRETRNTANQRGQPHGCPQKVSLQRRHRRRKGRHSRAKAEARKQDG